MRSFILIGALALGLGGSALAADPHGVRMFVRHDVADYGAWRKGYDSEAVAAMQRKGGVTAQAVYQSTDNPNDVTVSHDFKTLAQAKAFASSPELKAAMQKNGVKGTPQIWFTTMTPGSSGKPGRVRMFVRHDVADYATWRKGYDAEEVAAMQRKGGVIEQAVYQSLDKPGDVTVTHDFRSIDLAKAFAKAPELKAAMQKNGVKGTPQIWFTTHGARK